METQILLNQIAIMKALLDVQLGGNKYNELKDRIAETEKKLAIDGEPEYLPYVKDK